MLQGKHSAILSTFIKLPFIIEIFVSSNFEWPFYTDFLYLFHVVGICRAKSSQIMFTIVVMVIVGLKTHNHFPGILE